jgi:hypothetical protein
MSASVNNSPSRPVAELGTIATFNVSSLVDVAGRPHEVISAGSGRPGFTLHLPHAGIGDLMVAVVA